MKKNNEIKFFCDKCNNEMPVDNEASNKNWMVCKKKCICGGKSRLNILKNYDEK